MATRSRSERFVVAIYEQDLLWGGPEEGGWWYDVYTLNRVYRVYRTYEQAQAATRRLNALLDLMVNRHLRRPLTSVAYEGGHMTAVWWEGTAPMVHPTTKPRYC